MAKLLVMTDLHLTDGSRQIIGLDPMERLCAVLDHACSHQPDADRLLLLGDLTHFGQIASYKALRDVLADAPWPVSFLLGNHDRRTNFQHVFPNVPVDTAGFVQSTIDLPDMRLVTLDSLDENARPAHSGWLCAARLNWLDAALASADKPCLVFLHHTPFRTGFDGMDAIWLRNANAFLDVIRRHTVTHVFAGHIHRTIHASIGGVPITVFKSPCHQMPMRLGQRGTDHSIDEPGAYGIILSDGPNAVVHFEDVGLPAQASAAY